MQQFNAQKELNINNGTSIVGKLGISVALVNANPKTKLCTYIGTNLTSESNELPRQLEYSLEPNRVQDSSDNNASASLPTKVRKRTLIEGALKEALEKHFYMEPKPSFEAITSLAESLRMKTEVVRVWFANRRHKEKRKKPIFKSKRPKRTTRSVPARVLTPSKILDEATETIRELIDSVTESNSSAVQLTGN